MIIIPPNNKCCLLKYVIFETLPFITDPYHSRALKCNLSNMFICLWFIIVWVQSSHLMHRRVSDVLHCRSTAQRQSSVDSSAACVFSSVCRAQVRESSDRKWSIALEWFPRLNLPLIFMGKVWRQMYPQYTYYYPPYLHTKVREIRFISLYMSTFCLRYYCGLIL